MSSVCSAVGVLAVLSIIMATTAGTESDVTELLGVSITTTTTTTATTTTAGRTRQPSTIATSVAHTDHRADLVDGTELRIDDATNLSTETLTTRRSTTSTTTTTTTTAPTIARTSFAVTNGELRFTEHPEIEAAVSIASTLPTPPITVDETTTLTPKVKVTTSIPPLQERLVGLRYNSTSDSPEGFSPTIEAHRDESLRYMIELTKTTGSSTADNSLKRLFLTTTTSPTNFMLGKGIGSKTRKDISGGDFHEIKSAQKINSLNQGYFGRKVVKPNVASALGKYTPYFEDGQEELNVTARIGSTVDLDCEVGMLGNKTVTWSYRSTDLIRLLTVGRSAYNLDQRIGLYFRYPTNWRLRIQYAIPLDSGLYECQVSTYPPLVRKIHLLVTAPKLILKDDSGTIWSGERHLKAGSALRLRCEAQDVPERYNETVIWTRGDEILSEDVSENRTMNYIDGREVQVIVSTIVIEKATPRHAGNYSCVVPEKAKATVAVHVLNGELPAAVHDGNGVSRSVLNLWLIHLTVSYVFSR